MNRRKEIALVTAGILTGIVVSGPATQVAAGLMVNPSNQQFYVNEARINLEAYEIGGSNYVKLWDIGSSSGISDTRWGSASPTMPLPTPYPPGQAV